MPSLNLRKLLSQIPGYAGGNLQDTLDQQRPRTIEPVRDGVLTPQNREAITRPRTVMQQPDTQLPAPRGMRDLFAQQSQAPPPTMIEDIGEPPVRQPMDVSRMPLKLADTLNGEPFGVRARRAKPGMRDFVADDAQALRDLENQPRNWKDNTIDAIRAVNESVNGPSKFQIPTKRERNIEQAQSRLGRSIAVDNQQSTNVVRQAQADAARARPGIQREAQDEREINNALSQYNRLESYDPDDPADEGLRKYFESRNLNPPKKVKGSNILANWSNGRVVLTNKVANKSQDTTVTDIGRTPNAEGLTPNQQEVTDRDVANRTSREDQFKEAEQGRNIRANARNKQSERNATIVSGGQVARMGDPRVHQQNIAEIDQDIANIDEQIKTLTEKRVAKGLTSGEADALNALPREKKGLERERRDEREKLGKIESAQGNGSRTSAPSGKGRLTEQQVRDAATKVGLDADEAVRRARLKKRL